MKQTIEEYVAHAKALFPFIPTEQLISMVILHFDIPDKEAKQRVEGILSKEELDWLCWNCGEYNKAGWGNHCWICHKPKQKPSFMGVRK